MKHVIERRQNEKNKNANKLESESDKIQDGMKEGRNSVIKCQERNKRTSARRQSGLSAFYAILNRIKTTALVSPSDTGHDESKATRGFDETCVCKVRNFKERRQNMNKLLRCGDKNVTEHK